MKENVTITLKVAHVNAYIVHKGTKKPAPVNYLFPVTFRNNRDFTEAEVEEMTAKKAGKGEARLAWVDSISYSERLYEMRVDDFIARGHVIVRASKADGGTGRTREPIISREISSTTVTANVVPAGQKKPEQRLFTFGELMSEKEAEKAVEKAGKKEGFRLCWIDEISVNSALWAMSLESFLEYFNDSGNDSMNA